MLEDKLCPSDIIQAQFFLFWADIYYEPVVNIFLGNIQLTLLSEILRKLECHPGNCRVVPVSAVEVFGGEDDIQGVPGGMCQTLGECSLC